jgi:hypothetical protein
MSTPVYTAQLVIVTSTVAGPQQLFQARPGFLTVLRDISVWSNTAGFVSFYVETGNQSATFLVHEFTGYGTYHWEGRVAMNPGNVLSFSAPQDGHQLLVTGYELSLN